METYEIGEAEKIRTGLQEVSSAYVNDNSSWKEMIEDDLATHEPILKNWFHKFFQTEKYKTAEKESDRLNSLENLWSSRDNLVKRIKTETNEISLQPYKISKIRKDIRNLESAFRNTPQFNEERIPDSTLYELQFQYPDFVEKKSAKILKTPAEKIRGFNTYNVLNDYFYCLKKHAKRHPNIVKQVMRKMAEVYVLNINNNQEEVHAGNFCFTSIKQNAKSGISQLGKSLGFSKEEIHNNYLSLGEKPGGE